VTRCDLVNHVSGLRIADPDRRFYAFAVDRLVAWGVDAAVAVTAGRWLWSHGHHVLAVLVVTATLLLVGLVFAVLLGSTGATPGKALAGLRVVDTATGGPIGVGRAMLRTLVLGLAAVPFGFGLAALAWTSLADATRLRRGWHDHLVSSVVLDTRPGPDLEEPDEPAPRPVVNLTAARLVPARHPLELPQPGSRPARTPAVRASRTAATWDLALDTGERVAVDTLVLLGSRPEARRGERGARLVALASGDLSVSETHAQVVVADDGALVVTDRGETVGSTLVRQGMARPLPPGRPTTLLDGDVLTLGDRSMTVHRIDPVRARA
jgi:uncharacterized RDD family membrane protein YckC